RSMISYQSPYDEGRAQANTAQQPFPTFTQEENRGKQVFFSPNLGGCAVCHGTEAFIAPGPRSNGLDATITDAGVGGNTGNPNQQGLFKTPSLRNVAARPPYMHDGRFATLEEVVEHYNSGVQMSPNLHPALIDPNNNTQPKRLNLSEADKAALVAFLRTLDDNAMMTDEKFSDPFFN
ncbi:MAG: c-type cytochrome, partial [Schleiferiaceae bacterium]|nr:c-type cytochrome [Schleiferiaceae bacterium]